MSDQTQRLRDPIHGLISFDKGDPVDMVAWRLICTPEFQRLRRIKQLGVSDLVFPGATHTRFAHCIGVYHNARRLMRVVKHAKGAAFEKDRERVVLLAALLHDIGHGPFSHTFEGAREAIAHSRGIEAIDKHEKFTAKLILATDGHVRPILNAFDQNLAEKIAVLIEADDPADIYHAVVSSSFDADRLDYLMRDRYMTGTQAGTIDYEWLIDNLDTHDIRDAQDDDEPRFIPTFVFKTKGRQAAEDFLLARYRLYTQVYLHKTTRGFEQLLSALFQHIGADGTDARALGLDDAHPLWRFLCPGGESLEDYRRLDDAVVWGAIERLSRCDDSRASDLADRLRNRKHLRVLDVSAEFGHDLEKHHNVLRTLEAFAGPKLGKSIFKDAASYNLYTRTDGETAKAHKMVRVLTGDGGYREITEFPDSVISSNLQKKTKLTRYYFLSTEERDAAHKAIRGR